MGRHDWVAEVTERLERPLLVYVRNLLGDAHRAQDIVQEAFLELCRANRAEVEPKLAAWLYTVCRRRVIDVVRKEKRMSSLSVEPPAPPGGVGEELERMDAARHVLGRLATLPRNQQEAVRLRFLQQFSYREIAEVMGVTVSHVGVLLHLALKSLRESCPELETQS